MSELLTLDEVAAMLRMDRKTLINWRARRVGPVGFRLGKTVVFRPEVVAEWIAEQERNEQQERRTVAG